MDFIDNSDLFIKFTATLLGKFKKELEPSRSHMQGITAVVRISTFLAVSFIIAYYKGIILGNFLNGLWGKKYIVPVISYSVHNNSSVQEMLLNVDSSVQIYVLIVHVFSSFFAYECSKKNDYLM